MENTPGEAIHSSGDNLEGFQYKLYAVLEKGDSGVIQWHLGQGVKVIKHQQTRTP